MKRTVKVLIVIVVAFVAFAVWGSYADGVAQKNAAAFCESVVPGTPTEGILDRALAAGAHGMSRWTKSEQGDSLLVIFVGMSPYSRHICSVKAAGGTVVSREVAYLD